MKQLLVLALTLFSVQTFACGEPSANGGPVARCAPPQHYSKYQNPSHSLSMSQPSSLIGFNGIDIHLYIEDDGTLSYAPGRLQPIKLSIVKIEDSRPVDGDLVITLSNGLKLIERNGDRKDGRHLILLENAKGEVTTMSPVVSLQIK